MNRYFNWISILALLCTGCAQTGMSAGGSGQTKVRTVASFDSDWRFMKGDEHDAIGVHFDDSAWRKLDVPHDWSIEGPYDQNAPTRGSGGSLPAGIGWYRKTFTLPESDAQKRVFIDFDGVMANSEIWINGFHLGQRPYGYSSFRYELTGHLNFGNGNLNAIAVKADNDKQPASRWYSGAGTYRHVRLVSTDAVHVDHWGTFVTTPKVTADLATVHVQTTVINQSDAPRNVTIKIDLVGPDGKPAKSGQTAAQTIAAGKTAEFQQDIDVATPMLWDLDHPQMYRAVSSVMSGGKTVDDDINSFGIRSAEFKTESGFWLNGKNFKLLGVCLHCDGGAFGAAVPLGVWEHRLKALKEIGVNAIRTAHNPPAPEFLDLCDRMGLLVMDETFDCWTVGKNTYDYHLYFAEWNLIDAHDMVMRDRNHPSIVLYSSGNEIHDTPKEELAKSILRPLVDEIHKYDPTRAVTQALFRPNVSHDYVNGLADMLDVIGTNYRDNELIDAWKAKPGRKIVGTEQQQNLQTWLALRDNPQHSGQFLWAGIDYLGEAQWPATTSASGQLDRTGMIKPQGWERAGWWATKPMVKILRSEPGAGGGRGGRGGGGPTRSWTPRDPEFAGPANISVYSNCDGVEVFINGQSIGAKEKAADDSPRTWQAPYAAGSIKAVGKNKGVEVATDELKTAGKPAKIMLSAEKTELAPTFDDVSFVTAWVVDDKGTICPNADDLIKFAVSGPGVVAVTDNGDRVSHDSYQKSDSKAYQGRTVAVIKANASSGTITVSASAEGLQSGSATIDAVAVR